MGATQSHTRPIDCVTKCLDAARSDGCKGSTSHAMKSDGRKGSSSDAAGKPAFVLDLSRTKLSMENGGGDDAQATARSCAEEETAPSTVADDAPDETMVRDAVIPKGTSPGAVFPVDIGGSTLYVLCPAKVKSGQHVKILVHRPVSPRLSPREVDLGSWGVVIVP